MPSDPANRAEHSIGSSLYGLSVGGALLGFLLATMLPERLPKLSRIDLLPDWLSGRLPAWSLPWPDISGWLSHLPRIPLPSLSAVAAFMLIGATLPFVVYAYRLLGRLQQAQLSSAVRQRSFTTQEHTPAPRSNSYSRGSRTALKAVAGRSAKISGKRR